MVTIPDERQRQGANTQPTEQLLAAIHEKSPKLSTGEIVALRKMPSGDYQAILTSEAACKGLQQSGEWLTAIAPGATIRKAIYTVRVHGIRVEAIDTNDQTKSIESLRNANAKLHPGMEIARVAWPKRTLRNKQRYGSLIVDVHDVDTANRIISQGIIFECEIKDCDRFLKEARITQCVKCQGYSHIARFCKNTTRCGRCAGNHTEENCPQPRNARKCALCKGNHESRSETCAHRQKARERAAVALQTTPALYEKSNGSREQFRFETLPISTSSINEDGWQRVERKGRGRPSGIEIAGRVINQSRLFTAGVKRPRHNSPSPPPPPPPSTMPPTLAPGSGDMEGVTASQSTQPPVTQ